jgi:hypothetical protein
LVLRVEIQKQIPIIHLTIEEVVVAQKNSKKRKSVSRKPTSIIEATCVPLRLARPVDTTDARSSPLLIDIARTARDWRNLIVTILRLLAWHRLDFTMQHQQQTN